MGRLLRVEVPIKSNHTSTDNRSGVMGLKGAGGAAFMLVGRSPDTAAVKPYDGIYRGYMQFALNDTIAAHPDLPDGWDNVDAVMRAYVSVFTREKADSGGAPWDQSYFATGSQAQVRLLRLTSAHGWGDAADGLVESLGPTDVPDSAHWASGDASGLSFSDWASQFWQDYISPNKNAESQIECTSLVGKWLPTTVRYHDPEQGVELQDGLNQTNHGVVLKAPSEGTGTGSLRSELHSDNSPTAKYKPKLVLFLKLKEPTPEKPRTIEPVSSSEPDFYFRGTALGPDLDNPITDIDIQVVTQIGEVAVWPSDDDFPTTEFNYPRTVAWPDGEFRVENPRQPALPSGIAYKWRFRTRTAANKASPWSDYRNFTVSRDAPTVIPDPMEEVETLVSTRFRSALTIAGQASYVGGYEIEVAPRLPDDDPMWRSPIWSYTGMPVEVTAIVDGDDDEEEEPPSPTDPVAPFFQRVDGRRAVNGMTVDDRTPAFRLSTLEACDRYTWIVREDGVGVDIAQNQTSGITDGTCIQFSTDFALRRGKPTSGAALAEGEFLLPFEPGVKYQGRTYRYAPGSDPAGHSDHAVDFNRVDRQDNGEWIFPCAPGKVINVEPGKWLPPSKRGANWTESLQRNGPASGVTIEHKGGYRSHYAHMKNIRVKVGDTVNLGQRIGQVWDVGAPGGKHLHLQVGVRRSGPSTGYWVGTPLKMTLSGIVIKAGQYKTRTNPGSAPYNSGYQYIPSQIVTGEAPPNGSQQAPDIRVRARRTSDGKWSAYRRFQFYISDTGTEFPDVTDPGCPVDGSDPDAPPGGVTIDQLYTGPEVPPGDYSVRYRAWDNFGARSAWEYDHTLVVADGDDEAVLEIDHGAHSSEIQAKARIIIMEHDQPTHDDEAVQMANPTEGDAAEYSRGPGRVVAIIHDGQNIGISEYASTPGEFFFTLPLLHPQLSECQPYLRHYRLELRKRGEWVTRHEGLIHDVDLTGEDAVVYGYDYIGLLALSVEPSVQPDTEELVDAPLHPDDGDPSGSKYIEVPIAVGKDPGDAIEADPADRGIIDDQLQRAIEEEDSPVGWIEVGEVEDMPDPTTIYSAFVQRLPFIRGLIESYQSGSGTRSRVRAKRDRADSDRMKFDVLADSGQDRPDMRLEYGSMLQGFEIIPFADFATMVYGVGHRALEVKPIYTQKAARGMDQQVWGRIAKTALWNDVADQSDLARRVLQNVAEVSRIGKRVALAIRVRGVDVKDGWDVTDAIPLAIDRGPVTTRFWTPDNDDLSMALSWWVIWGYEWRLSPDGHDELVLVVRPRVDSGTPLADTANNPLLRFVSQHTGADWEVGELPDPPPPDPEDDLLTGVDTSLQYQPLALLGMKGVADEGASFAITKVSQGVYFSYSDSTARIQATSTRGMIPGAYHFLSRVNDNSGDNHTWNSGSAQCDYFISKLPGGTPEGLLCAVDWEANTNAATFKRNGIIYQPDENGAGWTILKQFINRWFELYPRHPLFLYTRESYAGPKRNGNNIKELDPRLYLWEAAYVDRTPKWGNLWTDAKIAEFRAEILASSLGRDPLLKGFGGFSKAILWQPGGYGVHTYTENDGTPKKIDGNIFKGTRAQLAAYAISAPVDEPDPDDDPESYRNGWNNAINAGITAAPSLGAGTGNAFYTDGKADARAAVATTLTAMLLVDPNA